MSSFNKVFLIGYMVADSELKQTTNGIPVTSFRIGVSRKTQKDTTDFINIIAWRNTAEFVCKYFSKGQAILVCGALQTRTWTDKDGSKRYSTEVVADEVSFVGSKQQTSEPTAPAAYTAGFTEAFEELTSDDDLPF